MQEILDLYDSVDEPAICFLGSRARTTYDDHDQLLAVMNALFEIGPFSVVHGGKPPFDKLVAVYAEALCLDQIYVGTGNPEEYSCRLDPYEPPPELLDHCNGVIVFHREGSHVYEASWLVELAEINNLPVIGIRRDWTVDRP